MTLADLYSGTPFNQASASSGFLGGSGGIIDDPWRNQLRNGPVTDDQRALAYQQQLSDTARQIGMRGRADDLSQKVQFLQAFKNRPVNLYGAPRNQAEQQLQGLVQQDQNARQAGVNNIPLWNDFRRNNQLKDLNLQSAQNQQRQFLESFADRATARDRTAYQFNRQKNVLDPLQEQSARLSLENAERNTVQEPFFKALEYLKMGASPAAIEPMVRSFPMEDKILLKNLADEYAKDNALKDQYRQSQMRAMSNKDPNRVDPIQANAAQVTAQDLNLVQDRAGKLLPKASAYTKAARQQIEDRKFSLPQILFNPFTSLGRYAGYQTSPDDNSQDVLDQFAPYANIHNPADFANNLRADNKQTADMVRQGQNGWESLLGQPQQRPSMNVGFGDAAGPGLNQFAPKRLSPTGIQMVATRAEAMALPPGTQFYDANGVLRMR